MKSCSHIFALITACVFLFCGCSNYLSLSKASSVPYPQTEYDTALKAYRDSLEMPLSPVDAEHGEDAPIVWEDTGMEAAVRLLLNRPEGTINRSDVWDLSTLTITERTMFEGDSGTTTIVTVTAQQGDATLEQEISAVGKESPLPALASLHDLQYFDRLQAFSYSTSPTANQAFTDFSGIEALSHLERFSVNGARPETLEPLSHLSQLKQLSLTECGTLDLAPLEGLPKLRVLTLPLTMASFRWNRLRHSRHCVISPSVPAQQFPVWNRWLRPILPFSISVSVSDRVSSTKTSTTRP